MEDIDRKTWSNTKHLPAKRSEVLNPIRALLENELKVPADLPRPLVNLGLGKIYYFQTYILIDLLFR
jgi:hypothetical protein